MNLAPPRRGYVIRYAYLWADETARGQAEGRKDRPAVVIALSLRTIGKQVGVLVVAITHSPPHTKTDAVSLPIEVSRRLNLGDEPSWIVTSEANAFTWPGPDLRPVPRKKPVTVYGCSPDKLLGEVLSSYLANLRRNRAKNTVRST